MDPRGFRRRSTPPTADEMPDDGVAVPSSSLKRWRLGVMRMGLGRILAITLVALPAILVLSMLIRDDSPSDRVGFGFADARVLERNATTTNLSSTPSFPVVEDLSYPPPDAPKNELLDGLLAPGFEEHSCLSRYQSTLYRKASPHKPSSYLISRLRAYEELHKRCGPDTEFYKTALNLLKSGKSVESSECRYVVWIAYSGLGNRILTLASTFLYALLTNRVLLVDRGKDMADLFCEPFPEKSWLLPLDFPYIKQFDGFNQRSSNCYGNLVKNNVINASTQALPAYFYLHLTHDYDDQDKLFFCDEDQSIIGKVPWLIIKTDNYFVPSLFLIPSYEQELSKLFPEKVTVFHHLGRYLFHPSNPVWGLITRYYQAYLAKADERIGIQIRVFDSGTVPFPYVMEQILACTQNEQLLPRVDKKGSISNPQENQKLKAVLMTSLTSGYSENLKNMYWEYPTVNGDIIGVYQPSHEEFQQTEKKLHNRKAWAEMYLLSLSDTLVTSAWSTFGYVAQSLGGLKPWILIKPEHRKTPNPPCRRAMSMDPCFHAPPFYDCKAKRGIDTGKLVPHVRHCEDMSWGLKLVDSDNKL